MNKKLLLSLLAVGAIASAVITTNAYADDANADRPFGDLVQRLSERFNVDESEVQAVFDAVHEQHEQEMEQAFEDRLSNLVADGKITEEQKQALLAKHQEMEASHEDISDLTPDERRQQMKDQHDEFQAWAEEQGIDLSIIGPLGFGPGRGGHMGMMDHHFESINE